MFSLSYVSIDYFLGPFQRSGVEKFVNALKAKSLKFFMEKNDLLIFQSILRDLQKCTSQENTISSLTALNEIISLTQNETKIPNNSDWILLILSVLENNTIASDICLKILVNTSKRHAEVRSKLLEKNIFYLLTVKLRKETDFWESDLILYSALIVVLIQGDVQAQNQMRISGCLSSMIYILNCILDESDKPLPYKNAELIIYTIIASSKNPHHSQNQTEIGWIIPKVLDYLEKEANFSDTEQFQLIKCFWFFLKNALEKNETNQKIFLKSSGVSVLFRSIQEILEGESCDENGDLMVKITGTLLKMRRDKEFLYQASHYCPVMILCDLLKTSNCLVVQQTVIFLDYLTREFPHTLEIINTTEIQRQIKKAKQILTKNKTTAQLYHNLWKRIEIFDESLMSQESLSYKQPPNLILPKKNFPEATSRLEFVKNHFCVIHDVDLIQNFQVFPELYNVLVTEKDKKQVLNKMRIPVDNFHEKQFKKNLMRNLINSKRWKRMDFNIGRILRRKIVSFFQKCFSFFGGVQTDGFNKRLTH